MTTTNPSAVYTDFSGLAQLRADVRNEKNSPEAIEKVARQFESIFTQIMLKSMRDASPVEGGLFDNDQSKMYREMFDKQVALTLSEGRGIGLKEMLIRQLGGDAAIAPSDTAAAGLHPVPSRMSPHHVAEGSAVNSQMAFRAERIESPHAFVQRMMPEAQRAAAQLGTSPEVLISQAALETGWGKAIIQDPNGKNSYNLFGIKADARWPGERVAVPTIEYEDGIARKEIQMFRTYGSYAESFNDYANFIQTNPRYENALSVAASAPQYVAQLQQAGYATDPEYASKINRIMEREVIQEAAQQVQKTGFQPLI